MAGGGLGNIGTAFVTVELDFKRAVEQANRAGQNIPAVEVEVEVDQAKVSREVRDALRTAEAASGPVEAEIQVDKTQAIREVAGAVKAAEDAAPSVEIAMQIDQAKVNRDVQKALNQAFHKAEVKKGMEAALGGGGGNGGGNQFGRLFADGFGKGFLSRLAGLNLGAKIFKVIKPAAFVAALGLAAQAASAALAGIVALTGSLSALSGAFVALPAVIGVFSQSMIVTKLAMAGVTDALGGLHDEIDKDKFKELTKPAQDFVRALDALKPRVIAFQKELQKVLLPQFTRALKDIAPAVENLRKPLIGTAAAIGEVAVKAAQSFRALSDTVGVLIEFNNTLISSLGDTGIQVFESLVKVMITARPLVRFMIDGLNQMAGAFDRAVNQGVRSGGLAAFFEQTRFALTQTIRLVGSLGRILGAVFGAATPTGNQLLIILNEQAAKLAEFLNTTKGQDSLRKFFSDALPAILEVGRLINAVTLAFFELGRTKGLVDVLKTVRKDLLPAFTQLVAVTTERLLPVLIPALSNLILVFADLAGTSNVVQGLAKGIGILAGAVHRLFVEHPGLAAIVADFLALNAIIGIGGLLFRLSGIGFAFGLVAGGIRKLLAVVRLLAPLLGVLGTVSLAGIGAVLAGPLGIVALVVALGAAFAVAYKKSTFFKKSVDGFVASGGLQFLGPLGPALQLAAANFQLAGNRAKESTPKIASFGAAATDAANKAISASLTQQTTFTGLFATAERLIGGAAEGARKHAAALAAQAGKTLKAVGDAVQRALARAAIDTARDAIVGLSASFRRFTVNAQGFTASLAGVRAGIFGLRLQVVGLGGAFRSLMASMTATIGFVVTRIVVAFSSTIVRIRAVFANASLFNAGTNLMRTLLDGLESGFDDIKKFITGIAKWIRDNKGPISADRKLLFPAGEAIMGGFDRGLRQRWSPVKTWVGDIGTYFKGAVGAGAFKDAISSILLGGGAGIAGLNKILAKGLGVPAGFLANGPLGFLHPTSGWADTLAQGRVIDKMFGTHMGSGLRFEDTVAGPGISQHVLGQAIDWGDASNSFAQLTKLATFASRLVDSVFKQVIWQNSLWKGGSPGFGFVADHMDHVHLGWQPRAAGGGVRKGQGYSWNERGSEMFVPHQSGYVMNAGRTKELISAIKTLAARPAQSSSRTAEVHVHSNAADPAAVGSIVMSNLGAVFSRA